MRYKFYGPSPYKHQLRGLKRALELNGNCALLMEPGTGKTRIVIDFIRIKNIKKVLVIAPLSVLSVWEDELETFMPKHIKRDVLYLKGPVPKRIRMIEDYHRVHNMTIALVNYDVIGMRKRGCERCGSAVDSDEDERTYTCRSCGKEGEGEGRWIYSLRDALVKWKPDCIIADESHYAKNFSSLRSRALHYLGTIPRYKFILTGTVTTNSVLDVYSQYRFLDPEVFGYRWTDFKHRYGIWGGFSGFKLMRLKNLKDLTKRLHTIAFEASKDQLDLPGRTFQGVRVTLEPKGRAVYEEMKAQFIAYIDSLGSKATAHIILTQMLRLDQICGGFIKSDDGKEVQVGKEKLKVIEDLLTNYVKEQDKKVVVFARFRAEIEGIKKVCKKLKINYDEFTGKNRDTVKRKFQDRSSNLRVLIAQIATGGIGINLTAAHIAIFYSLDRSADHFIQACDRLHRPGQDQHVLYQFLLADDTSDIGMYQILKHHKKVGRAIVHHWKQIVEGEKI